MLKKLLPLALTLVLSLTACGPAPQEANQDTDFQLVATTYPVYLMAKEVTRDVEGIAVCNLTDRDVVRHELVQRIIRAYEEHDKNRHRPPEMRENKA